MPPQRPVQTAHCRTTPSHHAELRAALACSRCVLGELGGPQGLHGGRVGTKMLLIYLSFLEIFRIL
jgi:hypothetical protein